MGGRQKDSRAIGTAYEKQAVLFLEKKGYQILERNFHSWQGEIDIIAKDGSYLVFIEVKFRKCAYPGAALEAITPLKRQRIIRTAKYYLYSKGYPADDTPCRFDVIAFEGGKVFHIENAFL